VASGLLDASEQLVNQMNSRIQADALKVALDEVERNQQRLVAAQIAITKFRNQELMIDPAQSSVVVSDLIARLSDNLAQTQTQISETSRASPSNPGLPVLRQRADALSAQIAQERTRISSASEGLARKLSEYERLSLEREFAKQALTVSESALESARAEARRQQLYLERVVQPSVPDFATMPSSGRSILTIFGINVIALLVGWLILAGLREHAAAQH
jgi:capsular polysaccharide transport system permease protein